MLVPYPGSAAYEDFLATHADDTVNWKYFAHTSTKPLVSIEGMTEAEMLDLVGTAYKRFYGRPIQVWRMLTKLNNWGELMTYARGGLGLLKRLVFIRHAREKDACEHYSVKGG